MNIKQKIRKIIVGTALTTALFLSLPTTTQGQSVETMAGNEKITLDTKITSNIAPKTNLLIRNRTSIDYNNNINTFGLVDLSYNINGGLDAVAETQLMPETGIVPRAGIQYFKKINNFSMYGIGTASIQKNTDLELLMNFRYATPLNDKITGVINVENITNIGKEGHNFSTQRIRAGINIEKYEIGVATDFNESNNKVLNNTGLYCKVNF